MSPLELLLPEVPEQTVPFSVRLAERRVRQTQRVVVAPSDRRAHQRRSGRDLEWLRLVRIAQGMDVRLIDLSEGGALLEVDSPLKPGTVLSLEISGVGLETVVPLEVLRCYVSSLRGNIAIYRGACAFGRLIALPGEHHDADLASNEFVGTDAALKYLLERCGAGTGGSSDARVRLERGAVLHVLSSLHVRRSSDHADPMSRYTAQLLGAILPALQQGLPKRLIAAALDDQLRTLPDRWQLRLASTRRQLASLIDLCATPLPPAVEPPVVPPPVVSDAAPAPVSEIVIQAPVDTAVSGGFQKIVVRYVDGDIIKGFTQDFHPSRAQFSLWPSIHAAKSDRLIIPMGRLKAVFFVRDFAGNAHYRERKTFTSRGHGRRLEVTFHDNEKVVGTTLNYRPDGQGFFLIPVDAAGNNTRIFVVASAVRRVRFL
jgi:hypothetical protein